MRKSAAWTSISDWALSWGFEDIIKAEPRLRQGEQIKAWGRLMPHNGDVMCFDQPGARQWMHDIIRLHSGTDGCAGVSTATV